MRGTTGARLGSVDGARARVQRVTRAEGTTGTNARGSADDAPRRITRKVNGVSVSTQIRMVRRTRERESGGAGGGGGAGTRGRTTDKAEGAAFRPARDGAYEAELRRRRGEARAEARRVGELEAYGGVGTAPVLLIDGYNVCGLGEDGVEAASEAFAKGDMDAARVALTNAVVDFKSFSGYRVVLVWDADRTKDKDEDEIEGDLDADGFQVVYSVKNDADSWIEARVAKEKEIDENKAVYVATSDGALSSIARGSGAYVITAKAFVEELRRATSEEREILEDVAIAARWNSSKKMSKIGVKGDDVKRKLLEMYKTAPSMELPVNAPRGDFKRQSEASKSTKQAPKAPKWAEMRAQRRQSDDSF
ncbi:Protein of unknown function DUF901 [Ostreococcus tauri]|uniref:NYN domain-containing protein n=1 Tax=Ostreococcus tauri TaxID=70448 RepID=A0A090M3J8_OSTTA|nr:Protein of unknown function DUF901 [Ostreococcus tauri]CEF97252.1 Protein of unknown function DUF901 [Ostreococcus tauri]|eukprot:XP_022838574.1 Protein of unknown function DUF901 [Ostreococcus tauri]